MKKTFAEIIKVLLIVQLISLLFGILIGGTAMSMAWENNNQNEYHNDETGEIDWNSWLSIGIAPVILICGFTGVVSISSVVLGLLIDALPKKK